MNKLDDVRVTNWAMNQMMYNELQLSNDMQTIQFFFSQAKERETHKCNDKLAMLSDR